MIEKTIIYTNFNGDEEVEKFFFNLTRSELVQLEMSQTGGLEAAIKKIIASNDGGAIMNQFRDIIRRSYGKKSTDGKRFIKSDQMFDEFESTMAYDNLFMELVTDPEAAAEFVEGIMPKDLMQEAQLKMEVTPPRPRPPYVDPEELEEAMQGGWNAPSEPREISRAEAEAMDAAELQAGLASKTLVLAPDPALVVHGRPGEIAPKALTVEDLRTMDVADIARGLSSGRYRMAEETLEPAE